ncbi:MAG: sigma-54 dependent transcriptional regulator [Calditrichia bacterium]
MSILLVDDEREALRSLKRLLNRRGFGEVETCDSALEAVERINRERYDIVVLDLLMPELNGLGVLEKTRASRFLTEYIILTAVDEVQSAVRAIKLGAFDYLLKPVEPEKLVITIQRAYERLGYRLQTGDLEAPSKSEYFRDFLTQSPKMRQILAYAELMASTGNPILITGESGTGKELLARGIHRAGPHKDGPFVAVNVASIPEQLFESLFFGHARGAFTGAQRDTAGYFEQAHNGTLFLDEIGELPVTQQAKLLRVLEEREVVRIGEERRRPVNIQVVTATNANLEEACREGRFRLDLYYRLCSVKVHLPPLRERGNDILFLANHFLNFYSKKHNRQVRHFSDSSQKTLLAHDYPGNVRELTQLVENAVILCKGEEITPEHLGLQKGLVGGPERDELCSLKENKYRHVLRVLNAVEGSTGKAAEILQVSPRQVQRILREIKSDKAFRHLLATPLSEEDDK